MAPHVLIVEDDDDLRQLYAMTLDQRSHKVSLAGNAAEALKAVRERPPDIIVLDQNLPDMDGLSVLDRLVQDFENGFPYLPQIILNSARHLPPAEARPLEGNSSTRIEAILRSPLSARYDFHRLASVSVKEIPNDLAVHVQERLNEPHVALEREVKDIIAGLRDSPDDARYRVQLESFLHGFQGTWLRFRAVDDIVLANGGGFNSPHALGAYRTLVDEKMPELHWHSRDVADYAIHLGRIMGLEDDDVEYLRFAGYYHDMGQLPAKEFYASGDVFAEDDKRRKFITFHPRSSRVLMAALGIHDEKLFRLVETHHANYDATGYPRNWSKEEIPLHGILRIADTMDSVKRQMQYIHGNERAPLQPSTVSYLIAELDRNSGTLFNPYATKKALQFIGRS